MYADFETRIKSREHTKEAHLWKSGLYDTIPMDPESNDCFDLKKSESHHQAFLISGQRIIGTGSTSLTKTPKVYFKPTRMHFELFDMIKCDSDERIKKICANNIRFVILTSKNRVFLNQKKHLSLEEALKIQIDGIEYISNFKCIDDLFKKSSEYVEDIEITLKYAYFLTNSGKLYTLELDPLTFELELIFNGGIRYIKSTKRITYAIGYNNTIHRIDGEASEDISQLFSDKLGENEYVKYIACCANHCFFVSNLNRVLEWVTIDKLGGGLPFSKNRALTEITLPFENRLFKQIVTGNEHTLTLSTTGEVYGCGEDKMVGTKKNVVLANQWKKLKDNISQIYADVYSSYMISKRSNYFVCGSNVMGSLGLSSDVQEVGAWRRMTLRTNKIIPWLKYGLRCASSTVLFCLESQFPNTESLSMLLANLQRRISDGRLSDCIVRTNRSPEKSGYVNQDSSNGGKDEQPLKKSKTSR
ncbi:hypothetical protein C9374_008888 [Naegleria lovaniensis]|uniref:Uncharacterized protein n=1 Tax=Naegleria lovaniensis TaxID=51637 RepID=A0AA88KHG5_NAELO|nr:uncharacterized protein C9374_008888 [Naegleria lovaniensis]KAG2377803.1 hypothetical protein C9374_008888 [Naegleria lovaniensis]